VRSLRDRLRALTLGCAAAALAGLPFLVLLLGLFTDAKPIDAVLETLLVIGPWAVAAAWLGWLAALVRLSMGEDAAARNERRRADLRWNAAAGVGLLFVGGSSVLLGVLNLNVLLLFVGLLHLAAAGATALLLPRRDPWAYDPELDSPQARAVLEGDGVADDDAASP
jgi:hypothetical protein